MKHFFNVYQCEHSDLKILSLRVTETKKHYKLTLLAPGLHLTDISVVVKGNKVIITNKKELNKRSGDIGYSFSSFTRTFTTLHPVDNVKVRIAYKDSFIRVTLDKLENCRNAPHTMSSSHPVAPV